MVPPATSNLRRLWRRAGPLLALALALLLTATLPGIARAELATSIAGWEIEYLDADITPSFDRYAFGPRFAASGSRVVWVSGAEGDTAVVLYDSSTGETRRLSSGGLQIGSVAIDGDLVAWSGRDAAGEDFEIHLHDLGAGRTERLTHNDVEDLDPEIENGRVLWRRPFPQDPDVLDLLLHDPETGETRRVNHYPAFAGHSALASEWVVWQGRPDPTEGHSVVSSYRIGTGRVEALDLPAEAPGSFVDADGRRLLWTPGMNGQHGALVWDLATGRSRYLTEAPVGSNGADLSPDRAVFTAWEGAPVFAVHGLPGDLPDLPPGGGLERVTLNGFQLSHPRAGTDLHLFGGRGAVEPFMGPDNVVLFALDGHTLTNLGNAPGGGFAVGERMAVWLVPDEGRAIQRPGPGLPTWDLAVGVPPTVNPEPFLDLANSSPYRAAIVSLEARGIMDGYRVSRGREARPAEQLLRAQFTKMLVEALDVPVDESLEAGFRDLGADLPGDLYPHDYVAAAEAAGVVHGVTAERFEPWRPVTRAQMITMVVRAAEKLRPGVLIEPWYDARLPTGEFSDAHAPNLRTAQLNGIMSHLAGYKPGWDPWRPATRAEAAQVLWELVRRSGG